MEPKTSATYVGAHVFSCKSKTKRQRSFDGPPVRYLVLKIWPLGFWALLVSWASQQFYVGKEAGVAWESDSLLWGEDNALLFEQGTSDWRVRLAQVSPVPCDLCPTTVGLSASPSVREDQEQSLSALCIVYPWLWLPVLSASHSCSIVPYWLVPHLGHLENRIARGWSESSLNVCPESKEGSRQHSSFLF